jgi:hypothetical protein
VELATVAELQVLLEGISLPARRPELLSYALHEGATASQLALLRSLPGHSYATIDEVGEQLIRVQPRYGHEVPHSPREESGEPPGGESYTQQLPESGEVRDKQAVSD